MRIWMDERDLNIHETATVHPKARLDTGVHVGPFCYIGERVAVHKGTRLEAHVFITGQTEVGQDCVFSPFSSIGTAPQDVSYGEEETITVIGNRNIFREFVTVNRGTINGGGKTLIGDDNYFMAYAHVAHDCLVGNETIFTNGATLGGHVTIGNHVYISAFSGIHQFCRVGRFAFIGGYSVITQDVLPYCRVAGSRPALIYGLNAVGLRRKGFSRERISDLKKMFKIILYSDLNTSQAIEKIEETIAPSEDREGLIDFIKTSKRGILKKTGEAWEANSG